MSPDGVIAKSSLVFELPTQALEEGVDLDDAVSVDLLQRTLQHLLEDLVQRLFRQAELRIGEDVVELGDRDLPRAALVGVSHLCGQQNMVDEEMRQVGVLEEVAVVDLQLSLTGLSELLEQLVHLSGTQLHVVLRQAANKLLRVHHA